MFAQAISFTSLRMPTSETSPRAQATVPSSPFGDVLTQQVLGGAKVDPADEGAALRELFHLLAMLTMGRVDGSVFSEHEAAPGTQPGPNRTEVETLKRVIRRLLRGGQPEETDPANPGAREPSLAVLFQSLPSEVQNLLRRAFPSVDRLLAAEKQRLLEGLNP